MCWEERDQGKLYPVYSEYCDRDFREGGWAYMGVDREYAE